MATRIETSEKGSKRYLISNEWMNVAEAARYMAVSRGSIYNWISKRIAPPYYKQGRLIRFKKSDLDHFLEGKRVEPKNWRQ